MRLTSAIGLRLALGAQPHDIIRLLVAEGGNLVVRRIAAGALLSILTSRLLSGLLFGARALDPIPCLAGALTLLAVALLAIYVHAPRASLLNPLIALRHD